MSRLDRVWPAIALLLAFSAAGRADSPWLYGIHFYGDPAGSQVEAMTGGKGIYSLEIVVTNSDVWWGAAWQRDHRFNAMLDRGHTIICRIEPQWGVAVPKEPDYPMSAYLAQIQAAADALRNHVHIWHVGNEMNLTTEWGGDVLTPQAYVAAYQQIRAAIRSVPSPLGEQLVLVGPVSPGPADGIRHTDGTTYLAEMCAALSPADVDGFAIHSYGAPWLAAAPSRADYQAGYLAQLCVIDHYGFSDKPVYITEWNRRTTPPLASSEAESAKFLHGAFADLHAWNQRARAHPISAACWFIYQYDDATWANYSIAYLHTLNPPGPDNDLFDAFQYACTLNLPTAAPPPGGVAPAARAAMPPGENAALGADVAADTGEASAALAVNGLVLPNEWWSTSGVTPMHWLRVDLGRARTVAGYVIHHAGAAGLSALYNTQSLMIETADTADGPWTIADTLYNPGQNVTERTFLTPRFTRFVRLLIVDPGRDTIARIAEFEVHAIIPGDFDDDGDIDLHDAAKFQICYTGGDGPGEDPSVESACLWAHFDDDGTVGGDDLASFLAAFTGP